MNFRYIFFVLILSISICLIFNNNIFPQNDTLAIVNGEPITSDQFINRFELTVYPGKGLDVNTDSIKQKFLYSLIAEKLLSNEASISLNSDDPNESYIKEEVKDIFLRDALYRKEVDSKIEISQNELNQGINYSNYNYIVDAFYFPDSLWANGFYKKIKNNPQKYFYFVSDSLNLCHDTLEIGYGESDETIENAFFGHDIGFNSVPANTIDGWVIFRVIDKIVNKKFSSVSPEERSKMVHDVIAYRKGYLMGKNYLLNIMKDIKVDVNYKIFRPLVYKIKSILSTHQRSSYEGAYYLSRGELLNLKNNFSFDPRAPMMKFNNGELSLGYIFDNLSIAGFAPIDTSVKQITFSLHSAFRTIVQNYFLSKKAKELGLESTPEVTYNTSTFLDAYRSNRFAGEIIDTIKVTNEEVNNYFNKHQDEVLNDIKLQLQIFSLDNIDDAADILNRLNRIKNPTDDTTGAVWLYASQLSELGAVLAELDNGSIYGPAFIKGKFTIFRLIDKKSKISDKEIHKSIQAANDQLLEKKRNEILNKYISKLASDQSVKIFQSGLNKVNVTPIQMLTFRYIGFGGKIVATPSLYPREEWIKEKNNIIF